MTARILIVEDESLIADLLQEMLEDLDCQVVGPAATVADAIAAIEAAKVDAGILDLVLKGERCEPVAAALRARGIPFVFATGMPVEGARGAWKDHPLLLPKPYTRQQVRAALASMLSQHAG
jgi:DNA-binding response OmpR family regulator